VEFAPVNLPQNPKSERPWLDYEQVKTFCKAVQGKDCELAALLALNGLRRSEILHLSADDVDLKSGIIHVRGATVFSPSGAMVDKATNKNRSSTRDVFIIIPRLNELIRGKKGRLITTHPNTLHSQINSVCRKNKLPEVGFHGLRHSYISLGFHLGVQDLTIASEVGHSTVQTTQNVYRHLAEQDRKAEIERMKQFFM
jgi:integrase